VESSCDLGQVGWGDVDWIGLAQDRNRWRALVILDRWDAVMWTGLDWAGSG
jgi:hypothetical protein